MDQIIGAVDNPKQTNAFFIDGPDGTGKTFCYNTITHLLRARNKRVLSVAWTGIASTLLLDGRTVHNIFQIPLDLHESSTSSINLSDKKAKDLRHASIIIWDEAPMAPLHALNAIDRLLRKIMNFDVPFGGKVIVLGGDFRQVMPVVRHGTHTKIIESCIKFGKLWRHFQQLKLTVNMRADPNEKEFADFLLKLGNGQVGYFS